MKEITVVKIHPEGDGVVGLYIDGELYYNGDEYHDNIRTWVLGFLDGLDYAKMYYKSSTLYVTEETCPDEMEMAKLVFNIPDRLSKYPEGKLTFIYK